MNKATIFDSNLWIAYLLSDDSQHSKAKKVFESHSGQVIVPEYVVLEVANTLVSKKNKEKADQFLMGISINKAIYLLHTQLADLEFLIGSFKSSPYKKLSFVDHHLLLLSQTHEVITFDSELAAAIKDL